MAYWINSRGNGNRSNWCQFYCDAESDIGNLPSSTSEGVKQEKDPMANQCCSAGSECFVLASTSVYMLNSSDQWIKLI